jgi:hypothetical protein
MRLNAAVSATIETTVRAQPRPAELLGVTDMAMYLRLPEPAFTRRAADLIEAADDDRGAGKPAASVIAVLTTDAVRLPCGLLVGFSSAERSLHRIGPLSADPVMVGNGCVQWNSQLGLIAIHAVRSWTPPMVPVAEPGWPVGLAQLRAAIEGIDIGVDKALAAELSAVVGDPGAEERAALALLGRGPGLTPSGDDVLAGLLIGARAFGVDLDGLAAAIAMHAPARTTALSSQLLRSARDGHAIRALVNVVSVLADAARVDAATLALLRVGHTSGAALATGLVIAGELALTPAGGGR